MEYRILGKTGLKVSRLGFGGGAGFRGLCAAAAALRASLAPLRSRPGAAWGRLRRPCSRSRSSVR